MGRTRGSERVRRGTGVEVFVGLAALLLAWVVPASSLAQPGGAGPDFDGPRRSAAVDSLSKALNEVYIFADVARDMESLLRRNLKKGEYDDLTDPQLFAERLTRDLQSVSHDLHLRVFPVSPEEAEPHPADEADREREVAAERALRARTNFGFSRLEILAGNVGYLRLDRFEDAFFGGDTAVAAMNFLANCDALIIDLRTNGGGAPSMIQLLASYLFEEPTHLNSFYIRQSDETHQFWTAAHVEGPRLDRTPLYVLTSGRTFSAAEEFTYDMRNLERATIVGETTGGGAHPVDMHVFAQVNLGVSLPFGRAINPISGTNWEGTGVEPHILVPAPEALDRAHLEALRRLRQGAEDPEQVADIDWGLAELESRVHPVEVTVESVASYVGTYGDRGIRREGDALWYQRGDRPPMRMVPMSATLFRFAENDRFRLEVELDSAGNPVALIGHYAGGGTDRSVRAPG